LENTEENTIKETIFWSGEEISDKFLAQYYSNILDDVREENQLLGKFEGDKYCFQEEIKKALIAVRKKVEDHNGDSYFVVSKTLKNVLTFKMRIFKVADGSLLAANLYLIEIVDDVRFNKPLKTFVAQYVDKNNEEFVNKAKYVFNINVDGEFLELERQGNENEIGGHFPRRNATIEEQIEELNKNFLLALIAELEKGGAEGKKIAEEYKKLLDKQTQEGKVSYTKLKKEVDILIEQNGGFKALVAENPNVKDVILQYNEKVLTIKQEIKKVEFSIDDKPKKEDLKGKEEKKQETSKAQKPMAKSSPSSGGGKSGGDAKKSGGGKKGGGGKKKDDKKKDNKKKEKFFAGEEFFVRTTTEQKATEEQRPIVQEAKNNANVANPGQNLADFDNFNFETVEVEAEVVVEETAENGVEANTGNIVEQIEIVAETNNEEVVEPRVENTIGYEGMEIPILRRRNNENINERN